MSFKTIIEKFIHDSKHVEKIVDIATRLHRAGVPAKKAYIETIGIVTGDILKHALAETYFSRNKVFIPAMAKITHPWDEDAVSKILEDCHLEWDWMDVFRPETEIKRIEQEKHEKIIREHEENLSTNPHLLEDCLKHIGLNEHPEVVEYIKGYVDRFIKLGSEKFEAIKCVIQFVAGDHYRPRLTDYIRGPMSYGEFESYRSSIEETKKHRADYKQVLSQWNANGKPEFLKIFEELEIKKPEYWSELLPADVRSAMWKQKSHLMDEMESKVHEMKRGYYRLDHGVEIIGQARDFGDWLSEAYNDKNSIVHTKPENIWHGYSYGKYQGSEPDDTVIISGKPIKTTKKKITENGITLKERRLKSENTRIWSGSDGLTYVYIGGCDG